MTTTIEINKKSVKEFLGAGRQEKFVIPDYQRPYAWTEDEVVTLFEDLTNYTREANLEEIDSPYFLGTIVSYTNENKEQEIIDGQQRITTLCLLIRAIYTKIESMTDSDEKNNFIRQIEPVLWETDELTEKANKEKLLLESRVFEPNYNSILTNLLASGLKEKGAVDNYSKNYETCQKLISGYATDEPLTFYNFINNLLNKTIVLPIKADNQDTALTIFSTLNDRGLPLSDADIFKAKIYNYSKNPTERDNFIKKWQEISIEAERIDESIQKLFYYYMFFLRALENDRKSTTPGLRKYYSSSNFNRLYEPSLMDNLDSILDFWKVVKEQELLENQAWTSNFEILKLLDILTSYPNEFWKYPVVVYYLKHKNNKNFETYFLDFLKKLFVSLFGRYIVTPTINAVKQNILNLNAQIIANEKPIFEFKAIDKNEIKERLKNPHRNAVRMLLKLLAYENKEQKKLLPEKWEIEHILPKKWQNSYFPNLSEEHVNEAIENLGNKILFEKRLNIIASNGYFTKKKEEYKKSSISIVRELSNSPLADWGIEEIKERNIRVSDKIMEIFNRWTSNIIITNNEELSEEELQAIKLVKEKGLENYLNN